MSRTARRTGAVLALLVFAASAYLLMSGSPLLVAMAIEPIGLPSGNLTTWVGIAALPAAARLGFSNYLSGDTAGARVSRIITNILLVLAAAWGVVSYGLAGNWAFNFSASPETFRGSNFAGEIFQIYTVSIVGVTLLWLVVLLLVSRTR